MIPVRRTKDLPTTSFRFHFTMDTLVVPLCVSSLPRHTRDFHPLENAHVGQTKKGHFSKISFRKMSLLRTNIKFNYSVYSALSRIILHNQLQICSKFVVKILFDVLKPFVLLALFVQCFHRWEFSIPCFTTFYYFIYSYFLYYFSYHYFYIFL